MRRDHRPAWLRSAFLRYEAWWTRRYLAPQFDGIGPHPQIVRPWCVEVFGAGITAGAHLHALASADMRIRLTTWPAPNVEAKISLGDAVLLTGGVRIMAAKSVSVGDGTMFAANSVVTDCDWHGLYDRVSAGRDARPVTIGQNVWIGDGAFVGKGVTIGDHAVVGARSVVVRDVPERTVVAGNPAYVIKTLDDDDFRTRMDFFATPGLGAFFDKAWREKYGNSTFVNWLRVKINPSRQD